MTKAPRNNLRLPGGATCPNPAPQWKPPCTWSLESIDPIPPSLAPFFTRFWCGDSRGWRFQFDHVGVFPCLTVVSYNLHKRRSPNHIKVKQKQPVSPSLGLKIQPLVRKPIELQGESVKLLLAVYILTPGKTGYHHCAMSKAPEKSAPVPHPPSELWLLVMPGRWRDDVYIRWNTGVTTHNQSLVKSVKSLVGNYVSSHFFMAFSGKCHRVYWKRSVSIYIRRLKFHHVGFLEVDRFHVMALTTSIFETMLPGKEYNNHEPPKKKNSYFPSAHRIHEHGIFTYMNGWFLWYLNGGKYTIHGSYGIEPWLVNKDPYIGL